MRKIKLASNFWRVVIVSALMHDLVVFRSHNAAGLASSIWHAVRVQPYFALASASATTRSIAW